MFKNSVKYLKLSGKFVTKKNESLEPLFSLLTYVVGKL